MQAALRPSRSPVSRIAIFWLVSCAVAAAGCDRPPCLDAGAHLDPFWAAHRSELLPDQIVICESSPLQVRFDFAPEPTRIADGLIIAHLEERGWVRIQQSHRKGGRKYFLEKQSDTLIIQCATTDGRTSALFEWSP